MADRGDPAVAAPVRLVRGALGVARAPRRWESCAGATAELWAGFKYRCRRVQRCFCVGRGEVGWGG